MFWDSSFMLGSVRNALKCRYFFLSFINTVRCKIQFYGRNKPHKHLSSSTHAVPHTHTHIHLSLIHLVQMTSKALTLQFPRPFQRLSIPWLHRALIISIVQCILYRDSWAEAVHPMEYYIIRVLAYLPYYRAE